MKQFDDSVSNLVVESALVQHKTNHIENKYLFFVATGNACGYIRHSATNKKGYFLLNPLIPRNRFANPRFRNAIRLYNNNMKVDPKQSQFPVAFFLSSETL